jgi:hypothetical protein
MNFLANNIKYDNILPYKKKLLVFFAKPFLKSFYLNNIKNMELQIQIKLSETIEHDKEVIDRLVKANLDNKVSGYLKKYEGKEDAEGTIELKLNKNKKDLFDAKLIANLDSDQFVFEREDYENLDDLVNNLFKHLKEELSSK